MQEVMSPEQMLKVARKLFEAYAEKLRTKRIPMINEDECPAADWYESNGWFGACYALESSEALADFARENGLEVPQ